MLPPYGRLARGGGGGGGGGVGWRDGVGGGGGGRAATPGFNTRRDDNPDALLVFLTGAGAPLLASGRVSLPRF
jgi:hypothetical protein